MQMTLLKEVLSFILIERVLLAWIHPQCFSSPWQVETRLQMLQHNNSLKVFLKAFCWCMEHWWACLGEKLETGVFWNARNASPLSWLSRKELQIPPFFSQSLSLWKLEAILRRAQEQFFLNMLTSLLPWCHSPQSMAGSVLPSPKPSFLSILVTSSKYVSLHLCNTFVSLPISNQHLTYVRWLFMFEFAWSFIKFHCQGDSWFSHSLGLNYLLSWSTLSSAEDSVVWGGVWQGHGVRSFILLNQGFQNFHSRIHQNICECRPKYQNTH